MTETKEQEKERHAKIEDLYACIERLEKWGYNQIAFALRIEADKLRLNWKNAN